MQAAHAVFRRRIVIANHYWEDSPIERVRPVRQRGPVEKDCG
jgi:hypothetical protein